MLRLSEILDFLNKDPLLKKSLALKGGTAINLTIFDLPRLSVDIDLDYTVNESKEDMIENRKRWCKNQRFSFVEARILFEFKRAPNKLLDA